MTDCTDCADCTCSVLSMAKWRGVNRYAESKEM